MKTKKVDKNNNSLELSDVVLRKIYMPLIIGVIILPIGVIVGDVSKNKFLTQITPYLSSITMGLSGLWQIKYRIIPGIPTLRGKVAIFFGILFMLVFTGGGLLLALVSILK